MVYYARKTIFMLDKHIVRNNKVDAGYAQFIHKRDCLTWPDDITY